MAGLGAARREGFCAVLSKTRAPLHGVLVCASTVRGAVLTSAVNIWYKEGADPAVQPCWIWKRGVQLSWP